MKKIVSGIGVLVFALYMMCTTAFATEGADVTRLEKKKEGYIGRKNLRLLVHRILKLFPEKQRAVTCT